MNSLGIYISVPFCRAKCTYCNFASGVAPVSTHQSYVERVCADVRSVRRRAAEWGATVPQQVDTVYLGGGTPSLLSPALVGELNHALRQEFAIAPDAEITLECAPGQLDEAGLDAMLALGVNRISFGVQSLVDRESAATGRFHTHAVVLGDLERVRAAGVRHLSIDLIAGLPHQTAASWQQSLDALLATGVEHASVYMLEIDDESRLGRELLAGGGRYHALTVPDEGLTADLYESAVACLQANGLRHYEISNFARDGSESRHNLKYWRRFPYLGFGLDAHSMLRTLHGTAIRFSATSELPDYLGGAPVEEVQLVSSSEELEEAWFLGLRLRSGVHWRDLTDEFGQEAVDVLRPIVRELCNLELLNEEAGAVRLTRRGILFSNEVFARFLAITEPALAADLGKR